MRRARHEAHARAQKASKVSAGLEGLRFHDLRGTAATNFIRAGLPLDGVATILGWELNRVTEIARLQEPRNRRPTVKPAVKT